jgi:iron complex outermembrane receptor protein
VAAELSRWSLGGYVQHEVALTEQLSLTFGGRLERCGYDAEIAYLTPPNDRADESVIYDRAAFDASILYRPVAGCKLYARVASLYRYPFLEEMASYTGYAPPALNTALKPESGYHYEIGAAVRCGADVTAELAAYQIEMEDEIAWDGTQNTNLDKTRRRGVDASLTWARRGVGLLAASCAYVDAEFIDGPNQGCTIPLVPATVLTLRGECELPADLTLMAGVRRVGKQRLGGDTDNSIARMDDYTVVNAGLRFTPRGVAGLQLLLSVDNLFDQNYANMAFEGFPDWGIPDAYYPAAGRAWRLTATYRF